LRSVGAAPARALDLAKAAQQQRTVGLGQAVPASVVAERIQRLRRYRWSSYRAYVGLERRPEWLTCAAVLALMSGRVRRQDWPRQYREFVETAVRDGLPESPWQRTHAQVLLGGAKFVARMSALARGNTQEQPALRRLRRATTLERVIAAVATTHGEPWERWRDRYGDWGRDAVLWLGRKRCGLTLKQLGAAVGGLDYRSVSSALRQFARRLQTDRNLARKLKAVEHELQNNEM